MWCARASQHIREEKGREEEARPEEGKLKGGYVAEEEGQKGQDTEGIGGRADGGKFKLGETAENISLAFEGCVNVRTLRRWCVEFKYNKDEEDYVTETEVGEEESSNSFPLDERTETEHNNSRYYSVLVQYPVAERGKKRFDRLGQDRQGKRQYFI
ncbi:hypothetical protein WH47_08750 [Habropoda laboriosa]|uniref:Mos1 transposase HTH domain-containing protein n=1 Tax=Habropoda laboriosa TaxID=597456 RepID=A0A0L7QP14_9HYME|nr:hypothetical protein WH47_08750 [Habropoda laboriosa]